MKYIDYYKVLGVDRNADQQEISRAYKKLARKYHPDLNKSPNAEAKFKELNEANEVLKNPETRQRYDTLGANYKHGAPFDVPPGWGGGVHFGGAREGGGLGGGFSDFFETFFSGKGGNRRGGGFNIGDLFSGGGGSNGEVFREESSGQDMESTLTIALEDAFHGAKTAVELSGPDGKRRYDVKIPHGIRDGERIRLAGQGMPGRSRNKRGDLYLTIHIAPHPVFRVEEKDLVTVVPVLAWDAALGCRLPVPTLDGEVQMTLPPGQSSGQRLRLKGKGLVRRGEAPGDLYAELKIVVPKTLSKEQEHLFLKLKQLEP
jgi:curved DNA-binding protein